MVSMTVEQMKKVRFSSAAIDSVAGDQWKNRAAYIVAERKRVS